MATFADTHSPAATASIDLDVVVASVAAIAATTATTPAPAGGTGAAAGGWDTAAHRDTGIAAVNACEADIASIYAYIAALDAVLVADGIIKRP